MSGRPAYSCGRQNGAGHITGTQLPAARELSQAGSRDEWKNRTLGLKLGYEHQKEVCRNPGEGMATSEGGIDCCS